MATHLIFVPFAQTRLEDWKDGGLPSKHLLAKLKEANKMVAEYEISAAPSGWKCVWDR